MNMRDGKSFFKGFVFALLLVLSINLVMAATQVKSIDVIAGNMKVFLDGKEFSLNSVFDNKKLEPFLYEGEIYLPSGALAKGLGLNVNYDSINNQLLLGHTKFDEDNAKVNKWLNEVKVIQGVMPTHSNYKDKKVKVLDNRGTPHNIFLSGFKANTTSFLLDKNFQHFRSTLVWRNGLEDYKRGFKVKVFLDEKEVWTSKIFEAGSMEQHLNLDVSLKDKLSFEIYSQEKKDGKYDDEKWVINSSDFMNRAVVFTNPALY